MKEETKDRQVAEQKDTELRSKLGFARLLASLCCTTTGRNIRFICLDIGQ